MKIKHHTSNSFSIFSGSKNKIEGLADGIFSIVMTLQVLELRIPQIPPGKLNQTLIGMLPHFLLYFSTFFILGVFWHGYRAQFDFIKQTNQTMHWIGIVFFSFISLIPFSETLLNEYGQTDILAIIIFWINVSMGGILLALHWGYVLITPSLQNERFSKKVTEMVLLRALFGPCIYTLNFILYVIFRWYAVMFAVYILVPMLFPLPFVWSTLLKALKKVMKIGKK